MFVTPPGLHNIPPVFCGGRTYRNVDHDSISACARPFYVVVARTLNSNSPMHCTDLTDTMRVSRMDKQSQTFLSCIPRVLHIRQFYVMVARHSVVNSRPQKCVKRGSGGNSTARSNETRNFRPTSSLYVLKDIVYMSKKKNRNGAGH